MFSDYFLAIRHHEGVVRNGDVSLSASSTERYGYSQVLKLALLFI